MIDSFSGDYRFLSNFWYFDFNGISITVEHLYQAAKTEDDDDVGCLLVLAQESPGKAKRVGRTLKLRSNWEQIKIPIMRGLLEYKFSEGSALASKLLETGDQMLVEGNSWGDRIWGVSGGSGQNWLGHLLMARRAELRAS